MPCCSTRVYLPFLGQRRLRFAVVSREFPDSIYRDLRAPKRKRPVYTASDPPPAAHIARTGAAARSRRPCRMLVRFRSLRFFLGFLAWTLAALTACSANPIEPDGGPCDRCSLDASRDAAADVGAEDSGP